MTVTELKHSADTYQAYKFSLRDMVLFTPEQRLDEAAHQFTQRYGRQPVELVVYSAAQVGRCGDVPVRVADGVMMHGPHIVWAR